MPTTPDPKTPQELTTALADLTIAVDEIIDASMPRLARKIQARFEAFGIRIDQFEAKTSEALDRAQDVNRTTHDAQSKHLAETDAYVQNMRNGLETTITDHLAAFKKRLLIVETRLI